MMIPSPLSAFTSILILWYSWSKQTLVSVLYKTPVFLKCSLCLLEKMRWFWVLNVKLASYCGPWIVLRVCNSPALVKLTLTSLLIPSPVVVLYGIKHHVWGRLTKSPRAQSGKSELEAVRLGRIKKLDRWSVDYFYIVYSHSFYI